MSLSPALTNHFTSHTLHHRYHEISFDGKLTLSNFLAFLEASDNRRNAPAVDQSLGASLVRQVNARESGVSVSENTLSAQPGPPSAVGSSAQGGGTDLGDLAIGEEGSEYVTMSMYTSLCLCVCVSLSLH